MCFNTICLWIAVFINAIRVILPITARVIIVVILWLLIHTIRTYIEVNAPTMWHNLLICGISNVCDISTKSTISSHKRWANWRITYIMNNILLVHDLTFCKDYQVLLDWFYFFNIFGLAIYKKVFEIIFNSSNIGIWKITESN